MPFDVLAAFHAKLAPTCSWPDGKIILANYKNWRRERDPYRLPNGLFLGDFQNFPNIHTPRNTHHSPPIFTLPLMTVPWHSVAHRL